MKNFRLIYTLLFVIVFPLNQLHCQEYKRDTSLFNEHQVNFEQMDFITHIRNLAILREYKGDTSRIIIYSDPYWISSMVTNKEYNDYLNSIKADSLSEIYQNALPDNDLLNEKIEKLNITLNEYSSKQEYKYYPILGISWQKAKNYCVWKTAKVNAELKEANLPKEKIYRIPIQAEIESAKRFIDINLPRISKIDSTYPSNEIIDFNKTISELTGEAFIDSTYLTNFTNDKYSDKIVIYKKTSDVNTFENKENGCLNVGFRFAQTYRTVKNSE